MNLVTPVVQNFSHGPSQNLVPITAAAVEQKNAIIFTRMGARRKSANVEIFDAGIRLADAVHAADDISVSQDALKLRVGNEIIPARLESDSQSTC